MYNTLLNQRISFFPFLFLISLMRCTSLSTCSLSLFPPRDATATLQLRSNQYIESSHAVSTAEKVQKSICQSITTIFSTLRHLLHSEKKKETLPNHPPTTTLKTPHISTYLISSIHSTSMAPTQSSKNNNNSNKNTSSSSSSTTQKKTTRTKTTTTTQNQPYDVICCRCGRILNMQNVYYSFSCMGCYHTRCNKCKMA